MAKIQKRQIRSVRGMVCVFLVACPLVGFAQFLPKGHKVPDLSVLPNFRAPRQPFIRALNAPRTGAGTSNQLAESTSAASSWGALSDSLILKPNLGDCQSFAIACHEGDIVTTPEHPLQTIGAGIGVRVGGVRFEYARGIHTGVNFLGIRTRFP